MEYSFEIGIAAGICFVLGLALLNFGVVTAKSPFYQTLNFFGALGKAGVNIRAIAQGSSERNISVVIDNADASRALRSVHGGFYLSPQTLSIGVVARGIVGAALLDQLAEQAHTLKSEFNLDLRVRAIAASSRTVYEEGQIDLARWRDGFDDGFAPTDLSEFTSHVDAEHLPHAVIIDCTASEAVARHYSDWLGRGIHVITPNKRANTAELGYYRELRKRSRKNGTRYLYETTVGAGLPIIQTLRDLVRTGDEVEEIEGIFSGTLAYLFNVYDGSRSFSEIVADAKARGFTEPDPSYHGLTYWPALGPGSFIIKARVQLLRDMGPAISPFNSFLLIQGIETLSLRMERHTTNAQKVAEYLDAHDQVESVQFAGLPSSPWYERGRQITGGRGAGSVPAFHIEGGKEAGQRFVEALTLHSHVANIGDVRSLAIHPATTTHSQLSDEEQQSAGVDPGLVRLSVGLESIDDIIADLEQGFAAAKV